MSGKSGKRPRDIPANPDKLYADAGWVNWPHWLGYKYCVNRRRQDWRPFREAQEEVHRLRLRLLCEWQEWSKSGKRPCDIPASPDKLYADAGWFNWLHWLCYKHRAKPAGELWRG